MTINSLWEKFQRGWLLFAALIAYYLPFVWHKTAALTANGYDLGEWISLHPVVRDGNPPLFLPLLLRMGLAGIALLMGIQALRNMPTTRWWRWLYALAALALALTLMPPLDFFRKSFGDANYQQQFVIANVTLVLLVILAFINSRGERWQHWLPVIDSIITILTILAVVLAVSTSLGLLRTLKIDLVVGGGAILVVLSLGLYLLMGLLEGRRLTAEQ